ncbi:hypothetical protein [Frankia sp. AgB32]|uniref:hypothetical protein n=1 Tax=Frankia sp. AgB32 TaxID=631119 RepID=UPI00200C5D39|nr:hypothetical protein [Frankia sp. AgB32]MCK9894424.1 hypothetical protein [Frankia sp. AgB32]
MSVPALVAVITAVLAGTASEAGVQVWNALRSLVGRAFGSGSTPDELVERDLAGPEADAGAIETLSRHLAARALLDPDFADALRAWTATATATAGEDAAGSVTNIVGDQAHIEGGLVQTRDVYGSITLGGAGHGNRSARPTATMGESSRRAGRRPGPRCVATAWFWRLSTMSPR